MNCLIIGNHTQGLGIIRSLTSQNYAIHLVNDRIISLSRFSKYLTKYHSLKRNTLKYIYQLENEVRLLEFIHSLIDKDANWMVFGLNEDVIHFLYQNQTSLGSRLLIPPNRMSEIIDKFRFAQEIKEIGLVTPRTYLLSSIDKDHFRQGSFLCKGRMGNRFRNISKLKGRLIRSDSDLISLKKLIRGILKEDDVLIQEKIKNNGEVQHCCGLAINGVIYRIFQYTKLRQHPDEFGTGTYLRSIRNTVILEQASAIIEHFSYTGIFEIEFVKDKENRYVVIEMNPRTWKSIHFATQCGQNICAAYANYMSDGIIPEKIYHYTINKTWVDLGTDIPMLIKSRQWAHPGYDRDTFFCVLDAKDPRPFLLEFLLAPFIMLGI